MKTIICGGRNYRLTSTDLAYLDSLATSIPITEVVSGMAPGADSDGVSWARARDITVTPFPANWSDLTKPDARIKTRWDGTKYDAYAGLRRNEEMAQYAQACVAFPGHTGTADMMERALKHKVQLVVVTR